MGAGGLGNMGIKCMSHQWKFSQWYFYMRLQVPRVGLTLSFRALKYTRVSLQSRGLFHLLSFPLFWIVDFSSSYFYIKVDLYHKWFFIFFPKLFAFHKFRFVLPQVWATLWFVHLFVLPQFCIPTLFLGFWVIYFVGQGSSSVIPSSMNFIDISDSSGLWRVMTMVVTNLGVLKMMGIWRSQCRKTRG